jgi:RNA polymerase sigma-B factor
MELGLAERAPGQPSTGRSFFPARSKPRISGRPRVALAPRVEDAPRARRDARRLLRDYHERGDRGAREEIIQQYLPLVRARARRFAASGEPLEDLIQVGSIGLINAIDRYRLDRGVDLGCFAIPTIDGEIKRYLRDRSWPVRIPRRLQELRRSVAASAARHGGQLDRPGALAAVAREVGAPHEDVIEALATERSQTPLPLWGAGPADDDAVDAVVEPTGRLETGYERGETRALLKHGFRVLDARERRLLHLAFFGGLSQMEIARQVGISQIHVSRLTRRALEKLRSEIEAD